MSDKQKPQRNLGSVRNVSEGYAEKLALKDREKKLQKEEKRRKRLEERSARPAQKDTKDQKDGERFSITQFVLQFQKNKEQKNFVDEDKIEVITKKPSRWMLRFSCWILAIILLIVGINAIMPMGIIESTVNFFSGFGGGDGFPVTVSSATTENIIAVGSDVALLTDSNIILYKQNGKIIYNRQHGFSNPAICSSDIRTLVYEREGKRIRIENRSETVSQVTLDNPIITADIAENGVYAVATSSKEYVCSVAVYTKDSRQKFIWNSAERRVVSISLSERGKYLAIGTLKAQNGKFTSEVLIFNTNKSTEPVATSVFENSAIVSVDYKGKGAICIFDNMMSYISRKGTRKDESFGSAQLISYHNSSKKGAAVVLNRYNDTHNNLLLSVDSVFKKTVETEINKECISVSMCGSRLNLLKRNEISTYNKSGKEIKTKEVRNDLVKIISYKHHVIVLASDQIELVKTK